MDTHQLNSLLRRHTRAILNVDGLIEHVPFILDPAGGGPVIPAVALTHNAAHATLHAPDEDEFDAVHLLGTPVPAGAGLCERFLAYHRDLPAAGVVMLRVESVKCAGEVLDAAEFSLANPLMTIEPALCRIANEDQGRLARACEAITRVRPTDPRVLGIDPWGMDVRARVGVMRVEFETPLEPATAQAALRERLNHA